MGMPEQQGLEAYLVPYARLAQNQMMKPLLKGLRSSESERQLESIGEMKLSVKNLMLKSLPWPPCQTDI